jgi:hypothetical protein
MTIEESKYQFMFDQIFQAAIGASFSTRNTEYPIYRRDVNRTIDIRNDLKELIEDYITRFEMYKINEEDHFKEIKRISEIISNNEQFKDQLHDGKFRYGIAQKLLNLVLKYLWCGGFIREPYHCPVDNVLRTVIIKSKPGTNLEQWTKLDSEAEYREYINAIKELAAAENLSVAKWELMV